jgi:HEAT repeat protein
LSVEEQDELEQMVLNEEKRDASEDVVDLLVLILSHQEEPQDFETVLEFFADEFQILLAGGEFQVAFKLLKSLRRYLNSFKRDKDWAVPLLEAFFDRIAGVEVLEELREILPQLHTFDGRRLSYLRHVLVLLPSCAMTVLAPMLTEIKSPSVKKLFLGAILQLAQRDFAPLEAVLREGEEALLYRLLFVLGSLKGDRPREILLKMTHHHSARIRIQSLKFLLKGPSDPKVLKEIFHCIADQDNTVRSMMMTYLRTTRNETAERLLLEYIEKQDLSAHGRPYLADCYQTLGQCGSSRSIPFLRDKLTKQKWIPGPKTSFQREAAATALLLLGTKESRAILKKASESHFPGLRRAASKVLEGKS